MYETTGTMDQHFARRDEGIQAPVTVAAAAVAVLLRMKFESQNSPTVQMDGLLAAAKPRATEPMNHLSSICHRNPLRRLRIRGHATL